MPYLPLTLFEQYLLHEDQPGYPSRIVQELQFNGSVNREYFEKSVHEITAMHPLLTATVEKRSFRSPHWRIDDSSTFPIHWHEHGPHSFRPELKRFDITKEVSGELHVIESNDRWTLLLNISHVICDGVASSALLQDILLAYDNRFGKVHHIPSPIPELLPHRSKFGLSISKKIALLPAQVTGLIIAATLTSRRISPLNLAPLEYPEQPDSEGPQNVVSKYLDQSRFDQFQKLTKTSGKSLNDHCLAFLHSAIGTWRNRNGVGSPEDWIRISVPKNLRSKSDLHLPACNVISITPIDRQSKGLSNRERLLRRAHEDMTFIKKGMLSLTFLALLWIHRLRPNGIRKMSHRNICRTTAVLSNIGRVFPLSPLLDENQKLRIENATLEKAITIAPIRPQTQTTLFLSIYGGELCMDLNFDPLALNREKAEELLDDFLAEFKSALARETTQPREN